VIIDGRDFLYPLFQIGNPEHARPIAVRLFGTAILRYVDRAWNTKRTDAEQRIAICSLAVQDEELSPRTLGTQRSYKVDTGPNFVLRSWLACQSKPAVLQPSRKLEPRLSRFPPQKSLSKCSVK
jgi:hypothetical protein